MKYNLCKGLFLLMAILCVGWVQAQTTNTIYVSLDGTGSGTSTDNPTTLSSAISSATDGTTIQLAAGEYTLASTLTLTDKSLSFVGADKSTTTINGNIELSASTEDLSLSMSNLTFIGTNNASAHGIIGLIGSGTGKNKLTLTNCAIQAGPGVTSQTGSVGVRMESIGAELNMTDTDIDVSYYAIGVRNQSQKVTIDGGTLIAWAAIMTSAGGLSTSDGTLASTGTTMTVMNANLTSRTYQVGKSNSYGAVVFQEKYNGVKANFTNCTITAVQGLNPVLNAEQAAALDMRSYGNTITFSGCTLKSEGALNYCDLGNGSYANAAVIRLGWHGTSDKPSSDMSTPTDNTITFTDNCSLQGKEDQALVYSYRVGANKAHDKLTINGTTYDAASGLICYAGLKDVANGIIDRSPNIQSRIDNAVAGEKIVLAAGEYALSSPLVIDKAITLEGADSTQTIIKGNWKIAAKKTAKVVFNNLTLTESETATAATSTPMIAIASSDVELALNHVLVKPIAPGNGDRRGCIYLDGSNITTSKVSLFNTTLLLSQNSQIGLEVLNGAFCDFSMDCSKITAVAESETLSGLRGMLIKAAPNSKYSITNSEVSVGNNFHYAIWCQWPDQTFTIENSAIYGWAAIYFQGAWYKENEANGADRMSLTATNSTFTGVGKAGPSNGFGVIVFEATENSSATFTNCTISNRIEEVGSTNYGFIPPFVFQSGGANTVAGGRVIKDSKNCVVTLNNCIVENMAETTTPYMVDYNNNTVFDSSDDTEGDYSRLNGYMDNKCRIVADDATKFLGQNKQESIVIRSAAGDTLRNAAISLPYALADANTYEGLYVLKPISYHNDKIYASNLSVAAAVNQLNVTGAVPTQYTLLPSLTIYCQDGVMLTEKNAAVAYSQTNPDYRVYVLTQGETAFTIKDVTQDIVITDERKATAGYANRNVLVQEGGALTIDANLSLKSVTLNEGGQIILANKAKLTANKLRTPVTLSDTQWKAFGFPVTSQFVDSQGTVINTLSDKDADSGIWAAGLANYGTLQFTYITDVKTGYGLLAATPGDYYVESQSQVVDLAAQAEPEVPAEGTFKLYSNPNLSNLELVNNKAIYTLDAAKNQFIRYEQTENYVLQPFETVLLTDSETFQTLRSVGIGEGGATANEWIAKEGYYLTTERGAIVVHTAEPMELYVVTVSGAVVYRGTVTDGERIVVPTGFYAVNGQIVRVK